MKDKTPKTIYLKNYRKPDYFIPQVELCFELDEFRTKVSSKLWVERNSEGSEKGSKVPLILDGEDLKLLSVKLNGKLLGTGEYGLNAETLIIEDVPSQFILEIENEINPSANKALEGLYKSGHVFCTQNEPEGMRKITYFMDRPDIMSKYRTKIVGDKKRFPVLLSNGNELERGDLANGLHYVVWEDPFKKPCYLFALVAGDLGMIQDSFTTMTNRKIDLRIYCDKGNEGRCHHAMESLKKAMLWDEEKFGLEYDLDIYMIVAVDAFNMGAMENKGLNIFNSSCVLAHPKTASDYDFHRVEGVIGHEYFHNWTGNRVTCRDWFQLTLKEGLTVFRDQEFSADMTSRPVQRIKDVRDLRTHQFTEDGGPMAHPIRPLSYVEINNFYTHTVYNKGAEVIRMVHTLIGPESFRQGMDRYFELFDGQAVTTEDFLKSMELASGINLEQFKNWYNQAGTPVVEVSSVYSPEAQTLTLILKQTCPATPGQVQKKPFDMPFQIGLLNPQGGEFPLFLQGKGKLLSQTLRLTQEEENFVFEKISANPILSLNRNFSAPIKLKFSYSEEELAFLMAYDSDLFNRWDSAQKLAVKVMLDLIHKETQKRELSLSATFKNAFGALLKDGNIDSLFKAQILLLPSEALLHEEQEKIEIEATHKVRQFVLETLAIEFNGDFENLYLRLAGKPYGLDQKAVGERALKNLCLHYLMVASAKEKDLSEKFIGLCEKQFTSTDNMTDQVAALSELCQVDHPSKERALQHFYQEWKKDNLVMTKWFSVQAQSRLPQTFDRVCQLMSDPVFDFTIPNLVRSLLGSFAQNFLVFHDLSGKSYRLMSDMILKIDKMNPQMASSLAGSFKLYPRLDAPRKELMKTELERILKVENLSKNVFEIVQKYLNPEKVL